jgi:hypothetical protein
MPPEEPPQRPNDKQPVFCRLSQQTPSRSDIQNVRLNKNSVRFCGIGMETDYNTEGRI